MANNRARQNMTVTLDHSLLKKIDDRVAALSPPGSPPRTRSWVVEQLLLSALADTHLEPAPETTPDTLPENNLDERICEYASEIGLSVEATRELLLRDALVLRFPKLFIAWMEAGAGLKRFGMSVTEAIEAYSSLGWQVHHGTHQQPPWREPSYLKDWNMGYTYLGVNPKFFEDEKP